MDAHLTLAITTIGDLLLENKISRCANGNSIDNINLVIPEYQRPYKWSARNAMQLLDDIIEARTNNKEVYRVGTLILHHDGNSYNIVDGQQRTITFALLLYALYELEADESKRKPIDFLEQETFDNLYSRRNIPLNLNAFRRRVDKGGENNDHRVDMLNLREFIEQQCELVVVITDDQSEAFQFFDSQNARGKALFPHDLLKAYHLREMKDVAYTEVESIVKQWELLPQNKLAEFFGSYLYRLKEWINGNPASKLSERNIHMFKGVSKSSSSPYAQFYKAAYAYSCYVQKSAVAFVSGARELTPFQLNAPVIAGKPFFEFAQHYYAILKDIQDNSKYVGFYVQDNPIVSTLSAFFNEGTGNGIARLMFDVALLLYVDRFCPATSPSKEEVVLFEKFLIYAFAWAYSLRAQYKQLGWQSAQNYILGNSSKKNAFNLYRAILASDTPVSLLSALDDELTPLVKEDIADKDKYNKLEKDGWNQMDDKGVYEHYIHFLKEHRFLIVQQTEPANE